MKKYTNINKIYVHDIRSEEGYPHLQNRSNVTDEILRPVTKNMCESSNLMTIIQIKRAGTASKLSVDKIVTAKNPNAAVKALFTKYNVKEQNVRKTEKVENMWNRFEHMTGQALDDMEKTTGYSEAVE
jgi:hypothetical protein